MQRSGYREARAVRWAYFYKSKGCEERRSIDSLSNLGRTCRGRTNGTQRVSPKLQKGRESALAVVVDERCSHDEGNLFGQELEICKCTVFAAKIHQVATSMSHLLSDAEAGDAGAGKSVKEAMRRKFQRLT